MIGNRVNLSNIGPASLRPYPEYKNSGLPWLGKIPAQWDEKRAKFYFREVDERSKTGEEEQLSVSHITGVTPRSEKNVTMFKAESYEGHKLCRPGDIVVNTMWAWMAALGVAKQVGIVSPSYAVYRPKRPKTFMQEFIDNLLRTKPYVAEYVCRSTGIRSSRLRLYPDKFFDIPILCPPLDEQEKMVAYLHHVDHQIRRFIRSKRRMIELLNEQKQVIINQAVTRGLDPNVRLKPSGVDWLGEVPAHWEMKPLKHFAQINRKVLLETTVPDFQFDYLEIGSVSTGFLTQQPQRMNFDSAPSRARRILTKSDTIISTVRTYLKAVYFVAEEVENLIASTGFAVLTPNSTVEPEFLAYAIQSNSFIERISVHSVGIAYPAIPETRIGSFHIAIPATRKEQLSIIQYIKAQTKNLDAAIQRSQREIDLIREYRERLITDVVTGKVDVRYFAAKLPAALETLEEFAEEDAEPAITENEELIEEEEIIDADD